MVEGGQGVVVNRGRQATGGWQQQQQQQQEAGRPKEGSWALSASAAGQQRFALQVQAVGSNCQLPAQPRQAMEHDPRIRTTRTERDTGADSHALPWA